jgi:hypothetical protein
MGLYATIYSATTLTEAHLGFPHVLQANTMPEIRQLPRLPTFFPEKLLTSLSVIQGYSLSDIYSVDK